MERRPTSPGTVYYQDQWVWVDDGQPDQPGGGFREYRAAAGTLWVPVGAKLHDLPFGFGLGRAVAR